MKMIEIDDALCEQMDEELEQETFGEAGQPKTSEVKELRWKLYPLDSAAQLI